MKEIAAIFAAVVGFVTRKFGTATASIASMIFLTAAFIVCINEILTTLLSALSPPAFIANAIGIFIPTDFAMILAAIISSHICRAAYDLAMLKVKAINTAT